MVSINAPWSDAEVRDAEAEAKASAQRRLEQDDAFREYLGVLRSGMVLRKPDARTQIEAAIGRELSRARTLEGRAALKFFATGHCEAKLEEGAAWHTLRAERLVELLEGFGAKWNPRQIDEGGTAETMRRPARDDGLRSLEYARHIDAGHVRAGNEIAWVVERITADAAGGSSPARPAAGRAPKGHAHRDAIPERAAQLHHDVYKPWTEAIRARKGRGKRIDLDAILDVIVDRKAARAAATAHRLHFDTIVRMVRDGLDLYTQIRRQNAREDETA